MQQIPDTNVPQKNRRVFWIAYNAILFLLLGAVVFANIQKYHEGARTRIVAQIIAKGGNAQQFIREAPFWMEASFWMMVSWATVALAVLSWGIALWYHEKQRWVWGIPIVLLAFFVLLQLLIV